MTAISAVQPHGLFYAYALVEILIAAYLWKFGIPITREYRLEGTSAKIVAILIIVIVLARALGPRL